MSQLRRPRLPRKSQSKCRPELLLGAEAAKVHPERRDSMNWEMLTAIGQLAAVCVGIPSLIYFAVQIREQTRERRQSVVNALTVQWGDLTKALHEDAEFAAIHLCALFSATSMPSPNSDLADSKIFFYELRRNVLLPLRRHT